MGNACTEKNVRAVRCVSSRSGSGTRVPSTCCLTGPSGFKQMSPTVVEPRGLWQVPFISHGSKPLLLLARAQDEALVTIFGTNATCTKNDVTRLPKLWMAVVLARAKRSPNSSHRRTFPGWSRANRAPCPGSCCRPTCARTRNSAGHQQSRRDRPSPCKNQSRAKRYKRGRIRNFHHPLANNLVSRQTKPPNHSSQHGCLQRMVVRRGIWRLLCI